MKTAATGTVVVGSDDFRPVRVAARAGLRVLEVPVRYRRRIGRSEVSGTVRGTVLAGRKILGWALCPPGSPA